MGALLTQVRQRLKHEVCRSSPFLILMGLVIAAPTVLAEDALYASVSRSEAYKVDASDGSGLRVGLYQNRVNFPLAMRPTHLGLWLVGLEVKESQFTLRGSASGERRLYRLALPIEFYPLQTFASPWGESRFIFKAVPTHNTDERIFDHRASQLEYSIKGQIAVSSEWVIEGGLRADRRFGRFQYYPEVGVDWQPNTQWHHRWLVRQWMPSQDMFSDLRSDYYVNKRLSFYGALRPEGGHWRYGPYENHRVVSYESWQLGLGVVYQTHSPIDVVLEYGNSRDRRLNMGSKVPLKNGSYWQVTLQSRLPK